MLRHKFPVNLLPDLRSDEKPVVPPKVMRPAVEVTFRPNSDIEAVAKQISAYKRVRLSAAVGAGKSTVLPKHLANVMNKPVILAIPSEHLAWDHYLYLKRGDADTFHYALDQDDVVSKSGVTITTYAWLTAKLLQYRGHAAPFGKCILLADEVHESDAYSDFIRRLGSSIPGVECFIEASATHDPDKMTFKEEKGESSTAYFPRIPVTKWDPNDIDKPWSMSTATGNMVIFIDNEAAAIELVKKYSLLGVLAYRMTSRMSRVASQAALEVLRDPNAALTVFVADYSFRNGFTFDVTKIIDSAMVDYSIVENGTVKRMKRWIYQMEMYQTAARGARTEGSKCVYYVPEAASNDIKYAICSLEQMEAEAVVMMLRAYGLGVPAELKPIVIASDGKIALDMPSVLNGFVPIALLAESALMDVVAPRVAVANTEVADILDSYGDVEDNEPISYTDDLFSGVEFSQTKAVQPVVSINTLEQLREMSSANTTLEPGFYWACHEAVENGSMGDTGWEAILSMVQNHPSAVFGLTGKMREDAVAKLLLHYNTLTLSRAAASRVSAQSERLLQLMQSYPEQVKIWSEWITSQSLVHQTTANAVLQTISMLRTPTMSFTAVGANVEMEEARAKEFVYPLLAAVKRATRPIDREAFFAQIEGRVAHDPGPVFIEAQEKPREGFGTVSWRRVKVGTRQMHDICFKPGNSMGCDFQWYVDATRTLLESKGVTVELVRKLVLDVPGVNADAVMQAVRDAQHAGEGLVKFKVKREK